MGLWISSHISLGRHPKTRRLARTLGIGIPAAVGHLHLLWYWAMEYAETGDLAPYENADIAEAAMWDGDPNTFVQALIECGTTGGAGFLDPDYRLHDWYEFAGKLLEKRKSDAERKEKQRHPERESDLSDGSPQDVRRMSDGHPRDGAGREENITKRREDNRTEEEDGAISQATSPAHTPPKAKASKVKETSYPDGFTVTDEMREKVSRKFPGLDIEAATEEWELSMRANRTKYKYSDWSLAWYAAMRRADEWQREKGVKINGQSKPNSTGRGAAIERITAELTREALSLTEETHSQRRIGNGQNAARR
jgi:hypothetical protein